MQQPPARRDNVMRGILLMIAAVTCFTMLDATGKWTTQTLHPIATTAVRYLSALVFITIVCRPGRNPGILRTRAPRLQIGRGLALVAATLFSFTALHFLPLSQATAIQFAAPLVVAALAGPLLGEWPGAHRIGAIIAGFIGVLVVTRPVGPIQLAVLASVGSAISNAVYALMTRQLAGRDRPLTTLFYAGLVGAVVMAPVLPFLWTMPPGVVWVAMIAMGVFATTGHYLMILAFEHAPASTLAPFAYTQLVGASVIGWLVFGDVPDGWTAVGGLIVGASGLYLLWRERLERITPPPAS